jgi:hypothetical protein
MDIRLGLEDSFTAFATSTFNKTPRSIIPLHPPTPLQSKHRRNTSYPSSPYKSNFKSSPLSIAMTVAMDFTTFKGSKSRAIVAATSHRTIEPGEALVRITHSGVCGTDEHLLGVDMGLGHEGVGVVEAVAPGVTAVKVGDRVGFGYVHWTCGECGPCLKGEFCYY